MKKTNSQKGITLVALIVTIVVLLILAVVTINAIQGDGIIAKAKDARDKYSQAQDNEQSILAQYENKILQSQGWFKGEAKGSYIIVNDVNEKQHDLKVTLTSNTITDFSSVSVSRYSTNLLDISQMLKENTVDNGDGTYTFTLMGTDRFSGYCNVYVPAGVPFDISINRIESTLSHILYVELTFEDGTKEYPNVGESFTSYDKAITKVRFFVVAERNNDGEYVKFSEPKINIGYNSPYEEYVAPKTVTANSDGTVEGLTSIYPNMILISNNSDVIINCEYKEKIREYNLYGKTIVNFGDSIFGNYRAPYDISSYLSDYTGATVYNVGFGGSRMGTHAEYWNTVSMFSLANAITSKNFQTQENAIATNTEGTNKFPDYFSDTLSVLKSIDFNDVDIITIEHGTNDFNGGGKSIDNASNAKDTTTFAGALRYSIETIKAAYPNIQIVLCTPTYRFWIDDNNAFLYDSDTYENTNGNKLTDFVQTVKDIAKEYNLFVIDNYYECGINATNRTNYFPETDGTHPNEEGRKLIATHMAKELYEEFK